MAEKAGKDCVIKVSGAATSMVGEATTMGGTNTTYQITDTAKQVLDRTATIYVLKKGTNDTAEAGTNTTTLKLSTHGLATNDVIINTSRANAKRAVTWVDADTVTVSAVTDQASGDTIEVYKADTGYTLNRLNGKVTYGSATSRTILISGSYLPMSTAAYANSMTRSKTVDLLDISSFGDTYKKRLAGVLSASGTLTQLNMTDTTFTDALTASVPVIIEDRDAAASEPNRFWALLESTEIAQAVDGVQSNPVSWQSTEELLTLGV